MHGRTKVTLLLVQLLLAVGIECQNTNVAAPLAANLHSNLNITSPIDDFVTQTQRQYADNIARMDEQLASTRSGYEQALSTITIQKDLLISKMTELDNKLYLSQLLNDLKKHCVQKYQSNLTTTAVVGQQINSCVQSATSSYNSYISSATSYRNTLNSYYTYTLVNALNKCKQDNVNPSNNYTICVTQAIALQDANTVTYQKYFNTYLASAKCSAETRKKDAVDCSLTIVYNTIAKMDEVSHLIENCSAGKELCPICGDGPISTTPAPSKRCPNQITIAISDMEARNATISNPFIGFDNIYCVELSIFRR